MKDVVDQGGCGSCWAVSSASVLRAHMQLYQKDRKLSAQQMVSCTPNPRECGGKGGCSGATAELAMDWVLHHGLANEEDVPYLAADSKCTAPNTTDQTQLAATNFGMTGWE